MAWPSFSISAHCSSVYGLVTRGASQTRSHLHVVLELDLGLVDRAGDRRGGAGLGRAGQRNVALAREQARGGIETDPARAG